MKLAKTAILFALLFSLSGCFQILHILTLNADRTIDVRWRLTLPRAFTEQKPGQPATGENPREKMDAMKAEIEKQIGKAVSNFVAAVRETDTDTVMEVSFRSKDYVNVKTDEAFVLMPAFHPATRQMVFHFKGNEKKPPAKPPEGEVSPAPEAGGDTQGFEQIAKMMMSSARYQIILAGNYSPENAYVQLPDKSRKELQILPVGNVFLIDFPFMAYSDTGKDGFDVVIVLK